MIVILRFVCLLILISFFPSMSFACSSFLLTNNGASFSTKNFDWGWGHGLVIVNKRGLAKRAMVLGAPAQWVSRFGSVTFNQVSRELPQGGLNEAGLNVEVLFLAPAGFPDSAGDDRPTINELEWAQYQLDNYGSTADVIAHVNDIRIDKTVAAVHYFICDSSNACATVDPLSGKYVLHDSSSLPLPILTNSTYNVSNEYAQDYLGANACGSVKDDYASVDRFARLACELRTPVAALSTLDLAFSTLASVSGTPGLKGAESGDLTQWSVVYDLKQKQITYFTHQSPDRKILSLADLDFSCLQPTQILDVNDASSGDVLKKLSDYTDARELAIVQASSDMVAQLPDGKPFPPKMISGIVKAAASSVCTVSK